MDYKRNTVYDNYVKDMKVLGVQAVGYFLDFLSGTVFTFLALEMFTLVAYVTVSDGWEKMVVGLIRLTPGMGLNSEGIFVLAITDLMQIVLVWGLVFFCINFIFEKLLIIKLFPSVSNLLTLVLGLHLVATGVGVLKMGVEAIQIFILFFALAILLFGFYSAIAMTRDFLTVRRVKNKKK